MWLMHQPGVYFLLLFADYGEALHALAAVRKHLHDTQDEFTIRIGWRG